MLLKVLNITIYFIGIAYAVDCENLDIEYPKGIENPGSGEKLYLSNLAYTSEYIYSGG
jgi:hypothetical protein